ncbi:MAG: hypothetical protein R3D68_06530 [Hyphomicrobiaceae bacterium]
MIYERIWTHKHTRQKGGHQGWVVSAQGQRADFLPNEKNFPTVAELGLDRDVLALARENQIATPKLKLMLDDKGLAAVIDAIRRHFPEAAPDIICLDPIRNLFDGGESGGGENDNDAMMFFLTDRVERLRDAVAPDCGVILAHHTRKMNRKLVGEDLFQALSGASALRGFYTSGLLMHRPDEDNRSGALRSSCVTDRRCDPS